MHYLQGAISLLLLVQKFFDLSILNNYIEMNKSLKLFMHLVLQKKLWMIIMCFMNFYLGKVSFVYLNAL